MVRYQSKQRVKERLKQEQLISTRSANLRMKTGLKTRTQTISKSHANRTTQTKSNLKRINIHKNYK